MKAPDKKSPQRQARDPEPRPREAYQAPRVRVIEISTQEALMAICKASASPCIQLFAPGS